METNQRKTDAQKETEERLRETLRDELITSDDPVSDEARTIYNAMIDKHPALIAQCATDADVIAAVKFVREYNPEDFLYVNKNIEPAT